MSVEETLYGLAGHAPLEGTDLPWGSGNYIDTLQAAFDEYFLVLFQLNIPELEFATSSKSALSAYDTMSAAIAAKANAVYSALSSGKPFVAANEAVTLSSVVLRQWLVSVNAVTWASFQAHESGAWAWAVENGKVSASEMKASAENVYRLWKIIGKLDKMGALQALKKPQFKGAAGLGDPLSGGAIIAIALASVAVIAIIAFALVTLKVESNRIHQIEQTCQDENGRMLASPPPHCATYFGNIAKDPNGHLATFLAPVTEALTAAVKSIAWVAGAGVLLYVGAVYVLPSVMGTFSARKRLTA